MKKKIAIIIERADIALGGAERSVFELAAALGAVGLEVDILAAKGQTTAKNIHILCQNRPGSRVCYFTFAKALKKHLAQNRYDIVHSVLPFGFADVYQPRGGSYAESILRNAASYQNSLLESYKRITAFANLRRTILLRAERKLCKNPDGPIVAALSEYVAEQFERHYDLDSRRLMVVPNGIKTDKQTDPAKANKLRDQILDQLDLKEADKPIFFLFAANNFRLKGLGVLLKAMRLVADSYSVHNPYLIVAGRGKSGKYRRMAEKLAIHKRVVFLGKVRNIQNALSIADVAVLPTFYDPCSRYILEAIAAARPAITTKFNGAVDIFVNNRHGKVIDNAENIGALAEAVGYFTNTDNIQKASQAIITDNLREKVSISNSAEQLKCIYESILEKRKHV